MVKPLLAAASEQSSLEKKLGFQIFKPHTGIGLAAAGLRRPGGARPLPARGVSTFHLAALLL
jgi:hypothetical protein